MLNPQQRDRLKRAFPILSVVRRWQQQAARPARIREYLAANPEPALNLGCGSHVLAGWLNTDLFPSHGAIVPLDAGQRLPFADATFHYAFSEHMIEHVPIATVEFMLRELHRVIRPDGAIRIATPNLRALAAIYLEPDRPEHAAYIRWSQPLHSIGRIGNPAAQVLNSLFYGHGHRFLFDAETLSAYLEAAGFVDCRACSPGESRFDRLRGLESHGEVIGHEINQLETLVVEARRP